MGTCARRLNAFSKLIPSSKAICVSLKTGACFRTTKTTVLRLQPARRSILRRRIALLQMIPIRLRAFRGIPLRIPPASRIYIPRVGPPALPKKRELRDDLPVTLQAESPKLPDRCMPRMSGTDCHDSQ